MTYDFDREIERLGTNCVKWEFIIEDDMPVFGDHADSKYGRDRLLPMWVADMDFRCAPAIVEALTERAQQGIFGYSMPCDSYFDAVTSWIGRRYGWQAQRDWIVITPGVVPAINMAVETFVKPGQKVLVQRPVYYPFFDAIQNNGAEIVSNSLLYEDGHYTMDFDDLARKAADPELTMAILCSPHNPVGRVWTAEELTRFGQICLENDVLVVADEIHCDLIYSDRSFTAYATADDRFLQKSIICTAASKSFNLAGLKISNIVIPDEEMRQAFMQTAVSHGLFGTNAFGIVAVEAAYNHGEEWLAAAMAYVEENYNTMAAYVAEHLPQLKVIRPEGTYLVWVDFRALGLDPEARKEMMMEVAKVYLDEGELFGPEGEGFERFNIACPRAILAEALDRIKAMVAELEPA
ncbi:MAG: MalY/PatB family protein [Chloroflexota bacterium]|jgi:cystathionine beta-lyase